MHTWQVQEYCMTKKTIDMENIIRHITEIKHFEGRKKKDNYRFGLMKKMKWILLVYGEY